MLRSHRLLLAHGCSDSGHALQTTRLSVPALGVRPRCDRAQWHAGQFRDPPRRSVAACAGGPAAPAEADGAPSTAAAAGASGTLRLAQLLGLKLPSYCCGCGVKLQQDDPDGPGYFQVPKRLIDLAQEQAELQGGAADADERASPEERERRRIDRAMEAWLDEQQRPAVRTLVAGAADGDEEGGGTTAAAVKCARCFSLVHYGKVRSEAAEGLLPEFDLARKVGRKIALQRDRQATVLCVVDVWDFDGSLPRSALAALFPNGGGGGGGAAASPPEVPLAGGPDAGSLPFTLSVAVNKFDLLPPQATAKRLEQWVRKRLRQAGLPRPRRVFTVSALNGLGVREMCSTLRADMGFRADLWVVGAQNAGKSSLICAMKRLAGSAGRGEPTIAPVPGTTLGLLRVPGVPLGPKHRAFDTPGVHHPYQLTSRLTLREAAAVLPRRRLKPRTYRVPAGSCVLLGGLVRVDVVSSPAKTLYLTVYASDEVATHLGKVEGAEARRERHAGGLLTPPFEPGRLGALPLVARTAVVEGTSWRQHSRDIAIAGLGWISVGCEGTAELAVWVPEGVMVTMHDALVPDYARAFQRPGFSSLLPSRPRGSSGGNGGGGGGDSLRAGG